ncbi:MAG: hypothetical protein Q9190_005097 [Brigantiaea leucoxantha]
MPLRVTIDASECQGREKRQRTESPDRSIVVAIQGADCLPSNHVQKNSDLGASYAGDFMQLPKGDERGNGKAKSGARRKTVISRSDNLKEKRDEKAGEVLEISNDDRNANKRTTNDRGSLPVGVKEVHNRSKSSSDCSAHVGSIGSEDAILSATAAAPSASSLNHTPPKKMIKARPDGTLGSPRLRRRPHQALTDHEHCTTDATPSADDTSKPQTPTKSVIEAQADSKSNAVSTNQATPKKVLKVRSDGKLASPKKQSVMHNEDRSKMRSKDSKSARQKIVILKYSKDTELGATIAQRIEELLNKSKDIQANSQPASTVCSEPSKNTHPFFLGKLAKMRTQPLKADATTAGGNETDSTASLTNKPFPKKPPSDLNAWASIDAFGSLAPSSNTPVLPKFPGMTEPIWPPRGMVHVRPSGEPKVGHQQQSKGALFWAKKKSKDARIQISDNEDILRPLTQLTRTCRETLRCPQPVHQPNRLRFPTRRLMTGRSLQQEVVKQISCHLYASDVNEDELSRSQRDLNSTHFALQQAFKRVATMLSAFDRFECDSQDWLHKYAPKQAGSILQAGPEALFLRDWLKSLTTDSVEGSGADSRRAESAVDAFKQIKRKIKKQKRKRAEELENFIVTSDEETNEMNQLLPVEDKHLGQEHPNKIKRTVIRGGLTSTLSRPEGSLSTNSVVISGPHGCGKSAAVYAVAQELGFEVFEINPGTRRSGKDILDRVGDMTRNHLVNHAREDREARLNNGTEDRLCSIEPLTQDLESGRQKTMNSFFQPKSEAQEEPKAKIKVRKDGLAKNDKARKQQGQKQSVILLEEVDVLFDEDRQFWATILELVQQSKRPLIMTCTDESLLPLDELPLFAIMRFRPPPEDIAIDYLLLLACNEGHLLSREAVSTLYKTKNCDLRASVLELEFFCQMAIGDQKGGLEWMLIQPKAHERLIGHQGPLRVVSEDTFPRNIDWLRHESYDLGSLSSVDKDVALMSNVWDAWAVDLAHWDEFLPTKTESPTTRREAVHALQIIEEIADALSVADAIPCHEMSDENSVWLDLSLPGLTDKSRLDFTEGMTLLHAEPLEDYTGLSSSMSLTLRAVARNFLQESHSFGNAVPLNGHAIAEKLPLLAQKLRCPAEVSRDDLIAAFEPLKRPPKGTGTPTLSVFDLPTSILVTDVAPYIRSVVSYDQRLEEQRHQLNRLTQSGRNGKRARTTRASLAALEGGSKANTRRERWFPNNTDFELVLQSGGTCWQDAALQKILAWGTNDGTDTYDTPGSSARSLMINET